jgi:hypothetical protein
MAFNGSGTFNRIYNWVTDLGNNINITASRMDAEQDGIATGLSNCITKDGQTTISANIPFNSKKITGLANGSARTDSISLGQVQDGTYTTLGTTGGSADAYTASPSPAITAYATGSRFIIKISADNTGASTIDISAVGAKDIKKYDGAGAKVDPEAGDLQQDQYYDILYDGTDIVVLNPEKPYINLINAGATTAVRGSLFLQDIITCSNDTDTDHDISFTAGVWNFDDGSGQAVATSYAKQIDATWAAGDDAGGLDTGTVAADTWYYGYAIYDPTNDLSDFLISASPTSPTMPTDYTKKRRIKGAFFKTNSSSNIIQFFQVNNTYIFAGTAPAEGNLVSATSQVGSTATLSGAFPAIACKATMTIGLSLTTTGFSSFTVWGGNLQVTPTSANPSSPGGFRTSSVSTNNNFDVTGTVIAICDNGQLKYRNFDSAGGVDSIEVDLISIEDLTPDY